jgi:predicted AlkP superfamily pyrophosphatase or phosphodiesterase
MVRRVVILLADGLRPDAVTPVLMPSLYRLASDYTRAPIARTVQPSATVAALASLATGVAPRTHRLTEPGLGFLPALPRLRPVAQELQRRGIETAVVCAEMDTTGRSVTWALATAAGVGKLVVAGQSAGETVKAARERLEGHSPGLTVVYLPDCDRAGHASGWMSPGYLAAAAQVDAAVGALAAMAQDALMIVVSDHGGGGVRTNEHEEPHPLNERITLVLAGSGVRRWHVLREGVSLLDVPPTVLWYFGLPIPGSYEGRVLDHAFQPALWAPAA